MHTEYKITPKQRGTIGRIGRKDICFARKFTYSHYESIYEK